MDDPCQGCMHRCVGRKVCDTCSRRYMDHYKPIPPSKPINPKVLMPFLLAEILIQTSPLPGEKERYT